QGDQAVADGGSTFELLRLGGFFHLRLQDRHRPRIVAAEEGAGQLVMAVIEVTAAGSGARGEAGAEFQPHAAGLADQRKKLGLVGEDDLDALGAIAELELVVEPPHRFGGAKAGRDRAEYRGGRARRAGRQKGVRSRAATEAQEGLPAAERLALNVKSRAPAADQLQLAE